MKDVFEGNRMEPSLIIPHRLSRCREYLEWVGSLEYKVWLYLQSYIIRSPSAKTGILCLYKDFYENGKLVARWSQKNIAETLKTRDSNVSRALKNLCRKKIIKIHKKNIGAIRINIYELGVHFFTGAEILYANLIFGKIAALELLEKLGGNKEERNYGKILAEGLSSIRKFYNKINQETQTTLKTIGASRPEQLIKLISHDLSKK